MGVVLIMHLTLSFRFFFQSELKSGSVVNLITFEVGQCLARIDSLGKEVWNFFFIRSLISPLLHTLIRYYYYTIKIFNLIDVTFHHTLFMIVPFFDHPILICQTKNNLLILLFSFGWVFPFLTPLSCYPMLQKWSILLNVLIQSIK